MANPSLAAVAAGKDKKHVVLMIEDDLFWLKLYGDQFTRAGFEVVLASTGPEGVHQAILKHPDVILLDLMLPQKSGFEVLVDLRSNDAAKDIPVIILSILGQESDIAEAMRLGAQDYLLKTDVRVSDVIAKVKEWLNKSR